MSDNNQSYYTYHHFDFNIFFSLSQNESPENSGTYSIREKESDVLIVPESDTENETIFVQDK